MQPMLSIMRLLLGALLLVAAHAGHASPVVGAGDAVCVLQAKTGVFPTGKCYLGKLTGPDVYRNGGTTYIYDIAQYGQSDCSVLHPCFEFSLGEALYSNTYDAPFYGGLDFGGGFNGECTTNCKNPFITGNFDANGDFFGGPFTLTNRNHDGGTLWLDFKAPQIAASAPPATVPEPGTLPVLGAGVLALGWVQRRRRKAAATGAHHFGASSPYQ